MKLLFIHAHFDDYEFTAAGAFEIWRKSLGPTCRTKVIVCTDGESGHQFRTREETGRLRLKEQQASARIGGYEFELLRLPNGRPPREACIERTPSFMPTLWKTIRDFEPDYLFCPPLASDPLAGVHIDHLAVAEAIRKVAYLINVPHCFTPEYPAQETHSKPCKVPVIINVHDTYMPSGAFDFAVDVESAFPKIADMYYCHKSQIMEWLPWVGRHSMAPPQSIEEWRQILRQRYLRKNASLGIHSDHAMEVFTVTAWGEIPAKDQLEHDLPHIVPDPARLAALGKRLERWRNA